MIATLENVKGILGITDTSKDAYIEHKLKSFEPMIRNYTNNKFLDTRVRVKGNFLFENNKIMGASFDLEGFRVGNTIEVVGSPLNDGLYTTTEVDSNSITMDHTLEYEQSLQVMITKVVYPFDIVDGVINLIKYDLKMGDKLGIKSESISRMSTTYYDVNSAESIEGYPASLMKFLNKYKKLRW
jgi:hypothetical protein|nr:MAG TPA: head to tail adaptor [Caudoviricetes sp.]